jgi:polyhydroxybutyrate depolymerase
MGRSGNRFLTWNAGFCCGEALEQDSDDVGFIRALIGKMQARYHVNWNRIYVTGISNGGIIIYRIGADLSDTVATIAPVAGSSGRWAAGDSVLWTISSSEQPVSVAILHGTADGHVPYDGELPTAANTKGAYRYLSVNESARFWVDRDGCRRVPN